MDRNVTNVNMKSDELFPTGEKFDKKDLEMYRESSGSAKFASIDVCIEYFHLNVSSEISDQTGDQLRSYLNTIANEDGEINWDLFEMSLKKWINSINSDNNNNLKSNNQIIGMSQSLAESFNESTTDEYIEWSIFSPIENISGSNQINESVDREMDSSAELEMRSRIHQKDEEIARQREELNLVEESLVKYQKQISSLQEKLNFTNKNLNQLELDYEERMETISSLEFQVKKLSVALEKFEKNKNNYKCELEDKNLVVMDLSAEVEKLKREKVEMSRQLNCLQVELNKKKVICEEFKMKMESLAEVNGTIEEECGKRIAELVEENNYLKNEKDHLSVKLNNYLNVPAHRLMQHDVSPISIYPNSFIDLLDNSVANRGNLCDELKESGFSVEENRDRQKIVELEEELNWYDEKISEACDQIEKMIKQLNANNNPELKISPQNGSKCFNLSNKISQLSEKVAKIAEKPLTVDASCQVHADVTQQYKDIDVLPFDDNLNKLIDINRNPLNDSQKTRVFYGFNEISKHDINLKNNFRNGVKNELKNVNSDLINDNSHLPSPHSNGELESKISLHSVDCGNIPKEELNKSGKHLEASSYLFNDTSNLSNFTSMPLSPIYETPSSSSASLSPSNMIKKVSPKQRKISVFQRTFEIDKISENKISGNLLTSTPLSKYRSSFVVSDSSESSESKSLESSLENDNVKNCNSLMSVNKQSVILVPSKLNFVKQSEVQSDENSLINLNESPLKIENGGGETNKSNYQSSSSPINNYSSNDSSMKAPKYIESTERLACTNSDKKDTESTGLVTETNSTDEDKNYSNQPIIIINNYQENKNQIPEELSLLNNSSKKYTYKRKSKMNPPIKRSKSDGEDVESDSKALVLKNDLKLSAFPSFLESQSFSFKGEQVEEKNLSEGDLERKYLMFSLGLSTDRTTLMRRKSLSARQRDQTERNLLNEINKMQQSIQELVPLCFDAETIEGIERVRHQIEIIAQCAHKVSCTSETFGAVQQELRFSRAIYIADRYLRLLRSRLEKSAADLAVSKQILVDNNIVIDEQTGEVGEELTAIRYRGLQTNSRTMIAKRRASIATIIRPYASAFDASKDGIKQRNSISGRVTLRRPSFSGEIQRFETDKLNRTESSNSVGELREIFEHSESRAVPVPREEANLTRLPVISCQNEATQSIEAYPFSDQQADTVDSLERSSRRLSFLENSSMQTLCTIICGFIMSFILGFFIKDIFSFESPFKWLSIEELLDHHVEVRNFAPRPI